MGLLIMNNSSVARKIRHIGTSIRMKMCVLAGVGLLLTGCVEGFEHLLETEDPVNTSNALLGAAKAAEQRNDYLVAAGFYKKLWEKEHKRNLDALMGFARNLRYAGMSKEALEELSYVEVSGPALQKYHLERGKLKLASGDNDGGIADLLFAAKQKPEDWQVYSALGIGYDLVQDFVRAQNAYKKALELSPNNAAVLNNLALSQAQLGAIDDAINTLLRVPNLVRTKPQIRQNLALFYGIKGDFSKAEELARMDLESESVVNNLNVYRDFHKRLKVSQ